MSIRVAIVEDDLGVQQALKAIVTRADKLRFVGAYGSAEEAFDKILTTRPEVALVDINLPGKNGIELVTELKAKLPELLVMMITVYEDGDQIFAALQAGAAGYLLKRSEPEEIVQGIEQLYAGGGPMSPAVASKVIAFFQQKAKRTDELEQLTARELEILKELAEGYRYKEIASRCKITIDTVRMHLRHIYAKLHVQSRTEAVVKFMENKSRFGSG